MGQESIPFRHYVKPTKPQTVWRHDSSPSLNFSKDTPKITEIIKIIIILIGFLIFSVNTIQANDRRVPDILRAAAGDRKIDIQGTRASFHEGELSWTVFGWTQPITRPTVRPIQWPVSGSYELLVVDQPISDSEILPFSNPVPNTSEREVITIRTRRGEHEPASFVIRSGERDLEGVTVGVTSLKRGMGAEVIGSENIDIRLVKCWYQSGRGVFKKPDTEKVLVPELLLHDGELVRVDHKHQVNLIRNYHSLKDAESLRPFSVEKMSNQQVWINVFIPTTAIPGCYSGNIVLHFYSGNNEFRNTIGLKVDVAENTTARLPIEYALFYLGWLNPANTLGARAKSEEQMLAEFIDMRKHGLTNVALDHDYASTNKELWDFNRYGRVLRIFRKAGFTTERLLYVDWRTRAIQSEKAYKEKLVSLVRLAREYGFREVFVYNRDEAKYEELIKGISSFRIAKNLGLKNFVACRRTEALLLDGLLDVALLPRDMPSGTDQMKADLTINGGMEVPLGTRASGWVGSKEGHGRIEGGVFRKEKGAVDYLGQEVPVRQGVEYELTYTIKKSKGGGLALVKGAGSCVDRSITLPSHQGTHTVRFTANRKRSLRFFFPKDMEIEIDDVSLQPVKPEKRVGVIPWAYGAPKAGEERPGTYRERYGVSLIQDGFKGTCNYAYQSGECWNDWGNDKWRPHVLAYPTISKPIPTIQWEALREAIDDIRHQACDTNRL